MARNRACAGFGGRGRESDPRDSAQYSAFLADGRLQAIGRTRDSKLFETFSNDNGKSWSALALTQLPNPNSGIDAVTLKDGRHLLVYNHTAKGRSPLNVAISKDGKEWSAAIVLESEPGEYSYPLRDPNERRPRAYLLYVETSENQARRDRSQHV